MKLLLGLALIATGAMGVAFIFAGTFGTNWPIALIPVAAWLALYIVIRILVVLFALVLTIVAISKTRRQFPDESINDAAERVKVRSQSARKPSDLLHD
jgi:hypothetical protein